MEGDPIAVWWSSSYVVEAAFFLHNRFAFSKLQQAMGAKDWSVSQFWQLLEDILENRTTFPVYKGGKRGDVEKIMFGVVPSGSVNNATQEAWGLTHRPTLLRLITYVMVQVDREELLKGFKAGVLQVLKNGKISRKYFHPFFASMGEVAASRVGGGLKRGL